MDVTNLCSLSISLVELNGLMSSVGGFEELFMLENLRPIFDLFGQCSVHHFIGLIVEIAISCQSGHAYTGAESDGDKLCPPTSH
jgi:hypothetical protein